MQLGLVVAELAVAFLVSAALLYRAVRTRSWSRDGLILLAIGIGALALRVLLVPAGTYHENHHGFRYLEAMMAGETRYFTGLTSPYLVVGHLLTTIFGRHDMVIFLANAAFSAAAAVLLGFLTGRLARCSWVGWAAALAWAVTPLAIRLAPTATFLDFALFCWLAGTAALVVAAERSSTAWSVLAVALLALEAQTRIMTFVHPAAAALAAMSILDLRHRGAVSRVALVLGASVVACLPWLQPLRQLISTDGGGPAWPCWDLHFGMGTSVLFDADVVSVTLVPLAGLGVLALLWRPPPKRGRWRVIPMLAALAVVLAPVVLTCHNLVSRTRFYLFPVALLTILVAQGLAPLRRLSAVRLRTALVAVGLGLFALVPLSAYPLLRAPHQGIAEYRLLVDRVVPRVRAAGAPGRLLVPAGERPASPIPLSWWTRQLPGWEVVRLPAGPHETASLAYVGAECYWTNRSGADELRFVPVDVLPGAPELQVSCAAALGGARWTPSVELELNQAHSRYDAVQLRSSPATIGLYERAKGN